jgi:hypothetical protein
MRTEKVLRALASGLAALALTALLPVTARPSCGPDAGTPGRSIRKTPTPEGVRVAYEWTDAAGTARRIDLPISRAELEASELALGFSLAELEAFLVESEIRIRREEGLTALDIVRRVVSRISDPAWCRVSEDPASDFNFVMRTDATGRPGSQAEIDRVLDACQRRWEASRKTVYDRLRRRLREYAGAHGMEITPGGIAVDYKRLVRTSAVRLKPLAEEFRRICGPSKTGLLEAVYSFVQSIPYRPTPPVEEGRYSAGVSVPLRVLAEDQGDCDSKAVLFAALWLNLSGHRTILIRVPEHMLVGVTVPIVRGASMTIQSKPYLLLELTCPGTRRPGQITQYSADALDARNFKYRIVS